jgi:DNA-binding response OmpR family regulator
MSEHKMQDPTIVVVEDDSDISFVLQFMLKREGFRVVPLEDGPQSSKVIESTDPPKLVLLDTMLEHENGFRLIDQIRKTNSWHDVPIVMLTAQSQEHEITRALEAGANDCVIKPFRPNELMARIRRLIN